MKEDTEKLVIEGISNEVFMICLKYIYTDAIPEINSENALPILEGANLFKLQRLKSIIEANLRFVPFVLNFNYNLDQRLIKKM